MPRNEDNNLSSSASLRRPAAYEIVKEARASLKEPSRPFTPGLHQRSLLSTNDYSHRPSSAGLISSRAFQDGGADSTPWDGSVSSAGAGADIWQAAAGDSYGGEAAGGVVGPRRSSRLSTDAGPSLAPHPSSAPLQRLPTTNLLHSPSSCSSGGSSAANPLLAHQSSLRQQQHQQQQQRLAHTGSFKGHSAPPRYSRLSASGSSAGAPALPLAPLSAGAVVGSAPRRPDSGALPGPVANPLYAARHQDSPPLDGGVPGRQLSTEMGALGLSPRPPAAAAAGGPGRILRGVGGSSSSSFRSSALQEDHHHHHQQQELPPMRWDEQQQGVSSPRPCSSHSSSDGEGGSSSYSPVRAAQPGQPTPQQAQGSSSSTGSGLLAVLGQLAALPVAAGPGDASRLLQACAAVQVELDLGEAAAAAAATTPTAASTAAGEEEQGGRPSSSSSSSSSRRCSRPGGVDTSDPSSWLEAVVPGGRRRLLAVLGRLVDCPHPEVLLKVGGLLLRVAPTGSSAALQAARLMYQLSKAPSNDAKLRLTGGLPAVLAAVGRHAAALAPGHPHTRSSSSGGDASMLADAPVPSSSLPPPSSSSSPAAAAATAPGGRVRAHSGGGAACAAAPGGPAAVLLYLLGALKHTSHDAANQRALVRLQALPVAAACLAALLERLERLEGGLEGGSCLGATGGAGAGAGLSAEDHSSKCMGKNGGGMKQKPGEEGGEGPTLESLLQVGVQVTGLLRNLAVPPEHGPAFAAGSPPPLRALLAATRWGCEAAAAHNKSSSSSSSSSSSGAAAELAYNAARVLAKLSLCGACQAWLLGEEGVVEELGAALLAAGSAHAALLEGQQQHLATSTGTTSSSSSGDSSSAKEGLLGGMVLRLAFVLGNLTTDSCEAAAVLGASPGFVPWLLGYGNLLLAQWEASRQQQQQQQQQTGSPENEQQQGASGVGAGAGPGAQHSMAARSSAAQLTQNMSQRPLSGRAGWSGAPHSSSASSSSSLRPAHLGGPHYQEPAAAPGAAPGVLDGPTVAAEGPGSAPAASTQPPPPPAAAAAAGGCSHEALLTKVVRLVANLGVEGEGVGPALAATPGVAALVGGVLAAADPEAQEELALTAAAALTNLAYYTGPECQLLEGSVALPLLRRLVPLLLSPNPEAQGEAGRALGNLARGCPPLQDLLASCWEEEDTPAAGAGAGAAEDGEVEAGDEAGARAAARLLLQGCVLLLDAGSWEVVGAALGALLNITCGAALEGLVTRVQLVPALLGVLQRCLDDAAAAAAESAADAEGAEGDTPAAPSGKAAAGGGGEVAAMVELDPLALQAADLALKALCNIVMQDAAAVAEQEGQVDGDLSYSGCLLTQACGGSGEQAVGLMSRQQLQEVREVVGAVAEAALSRGWLLELADSAALQRLQQVLL